MKRASICRTECQCDELLSKRFDNGHLCGLEGQYIAERVIQNRTDERYFAGLIWIEGLPCSLHLPLCLDRIEVIDIRTLRADYEGQRIRLVLSCSVTDTCGCSAEGTACIELDTCAVCRGTVRRGAKIRLCRACPQQGSSFFVELSVFLHTVVTQCELLCGMDERKRCTPQQLPIYPKPAKWPLKRCSSEHSER